MSREGTVYRMQRTSMVLWVLTLALKSSWGISNEAVTRGNLVISSLLDRGFRDQSSLEMLERG
jgi:hypothetical protein